MIPDNFISSTSHLWPTVENFKCIEKNYDKTNSYCIGALLYGCSVEVSEWALYNSSLPYTIAQSQIHQNFK